ncbi:hypothetical protein [Phocaeicola vulgatus]|uniref:hypothetical protein n=1 Tax=Phocaeicola vulgatus TaxID=821 RepID=UPI003DA22692
MNTKQKIKAPKMINGRMMRYCVKYNVWVNNAGDYAYREYNDPTWNCPLIIHTRPDGSKFLNTKSHGEIPLDEAIAICYRPMPNDGKKYKLVHNDGNLGNCQANNLEWKEVRKYDPLATERTLDNGLKVKADGTILDKKKALPIVKETGNSDMDQMTAIDPYVRYYRKNPWGRTEEKHAHIDDLMAAAEYVVDGDKSTMQRPRVLHKNMDYLDFHADNLKWVEESSAEYQEYIKKKQDDIDKLTKELNRNNPNFKLPDNQ